MQVSRILHFQQEMYFLPEGIQRIHGRFEINAMFRTAVQFFSSTCHVLKTWFELTRAKLYRNDLKKILGIGGRFELSMGKLQ